MSRQFMPLVLALPLACVLAFGAAPFTSPSLKPDTADAATEDDRTKLATDNTQFAFDLLQKLPAEGNLTVSPFAVSSVLSMTSAGAKGETAEQMRKALRFNQEEKRHPAFASLLWKLSGEGKPRPYELKVANAVWTQRGLDVKEPFAGVLKKNYMSSVQEVDFRDDEAAAAINDWAKKATDGRIKEAIKADDLAKNTKMLLASAVSFQGEWERKFDRKETKKGDFHLTATKKVQVPLMSREAGYKYRDAKTKDEPMTLVLPFAGGEAEFVLLLPAQGKLQELEKTLTPEKFSGWLNEMRERWIQVALPRFTLGTHVDLNDALKSLGMPLAFDIDKADFSAMCETPLYIARVSQQAVVQIDEDGGKAAALATVEMRPRSIAQLFRADRPFLFLIRHAPTQTVLFIGRVVDPS